jgi:hypothetical protein
VVVKADVFSGEFEVSLTTQDFEDFQKQLATVVERLAGIACFENMEETLRISVEVQSNGEVVINGAA